MHVRCDNQILGQPMLFECIGICVLSPTHESEMRDYLVYVLIVKYLLILFKFSHSTLDWTDLTWNLGRFFKTFLRGLWTIIFIRII